MQVDKKTITLIALNTAFVTHKNLGGGDRMLMELISRLPGNITPIVILPPIGMAHWRKLKLPKRIYRILPATTFDGNESRVAIFFAYLLRLRYTLKILGNLLQMNENSVIYTASDYFVDVIPITLLKLKFRHARWLAQTYHIVHPPRERTGNILNNTAAYLLQRTSFLLIRYQANHIFADNPKTLVFFKKRFRGPVTLLGGSVDTDRTQKLIPRLVPASETVIVGRLDPTKNMPGALTVWKGVTKILPYAHLNIIGTSSRSRINALKTMISQAGLEKNITLTGFVPHEGRPNIFDHLKRSRIFLFLESEGGRSLALLEALACGLPVIALPHSLFENNFVTGGIKICPDIPSIAAEIVNLLNHPSYYLSLSRKALIEARRFDWNSSMNHFASILKHEPK